MFWRILKQCLTILQKQAIIEMMKILIADDNKQISTILAEYAKKEGFLVELAANGEEALQKAINIDFSIILLDVMMPVYDGFYVCKAIRQTKNTPIIMITAKGEDYEKILGLDNGADDYIVKPFSPSEVMARIRAILRRVSASEAGSIFSCGNLSIDIENYIVKIGDEPVVLTKKEVEILYTLAFNKTKTFTRDNLLDSVWGHDYFGDDRTVDSHIKRLRIKLGEEGKKIKTVWGVGYKFEEV